MAKEIKTVKLQGYSKTPSDYECMDGELSLSIAALNEGSGLKPLQNPVVVAQLPQDYDYEVMYKHKTADYEHYIYKNGNRCFWSDTEDIEDDSQYHEIYLDGQKIKAITSMGNTLLITTDTGIYYFLWSQDLSQQYDYVALGNKLPDIQCIFGLQCGIDNSQPYSVSDEGTIVTIEGVDYPNYSSEELEFVSVNIMGNVNKFMAERIKDNNRFCMPFFVRYAYRLYDGTTLTHQSEPILMLPTENSSPIVMGECVDDGGLVKLDYMIMAPSCQLDVQASIPRGWAKYKDIIKSVDIYVSSPVYTYDQNGKTVTFTDINKDNSYGVYKKTDLAHYQEPLLSKLSHYQRWRLTDSIKVSKGMLRPLHIELPSKDTTSIDKVMAETSNYYLVKSYPFDHLPQQREVINMDKGVLTTLESRESLRDDYDSHDRLIPDVAYVYNSRMHFGGLRKELYPGSMGQAYQDGYTYVTQYSPTYPHYATAADDFTADCFVVAEMYVYLRHDGREIILQRNNLSTLLSCKLPLAGCVIPYFYHPDSHVYRVEMYGTHNGQIKKLSLPMVKHELLNGAYYYDKLTANDIQDVGSIDVTPSEDKTISIKNEIYVSEVGNPFYFPPENEVTIGSDNIIAMRSAARAMSTSQFGSYPLYVFTESEVWTLSVNADGTYGVPSVLPRAVCVNPDNITQLDSTVIYATDRGIMQLVGSELKCISDSIITQDAQDALNLPYLNQLFDDQLFDMRKALKDIKMIYDDVHQRVICYYPYPWQEDGMQNYAYVYSLKSAMWGMMPCNVVSHFNAMPSTLAVTDTKQLVSFADTGDIYDETPVCIVTRPIKTANPEMIKTIHTLMINGMYRNNKISVVLWGSRDLESWCFIGSSKKPILRHLSGTGYRYFRVGIVGNLATHESLSGMTIEIDNRAYVLR